MPTAAGRALPPEIRARLAARLPAGYDVNELRWLETAAQILPDDFLDTTETALAERLATAAKQAGPPMINADGKPTILKIVTWMCHSDVANRNGDAFVGEELKTLAGSLFREPNFGVMDWNHAAVLQFNSDPVCMGVWHKADYAFDKTANGGQGAWGVLVTGIMFAWLFPTQTDALVAEQLRSGSIKGSMACIPASVEFGDVGGARAAILHNPVFFTHSLLDKPPADPDAVGRVAEDPAVSVDDLRKQLVPATYQISVDVSQAGGPELIAALKRALEEFADTEERMTPEEIAALEAAKAAAEAKVTELEAALAEFEAKSVEQAAQHDAAVAEVNAKVTAAAAKVTELEAALEAAKASADEAVKAEVATLKTQLAEIAAATEALKAELAAAQDAIATKDATIAELSEKVTAIEAAEAAKTQETTLAKRKTELSDSYLKAHDKHPTEVKTRIETAWLALDDAGWELKKAELGAATVKVGFVRRSEAEGLLPTGQDSDGILAKIQASLKKR